MEYSTSFTCSSMRQSTSIEDLPVYDFWSCSHFHQSYHPVKNSFVEPPPYTGKSHKLFQKLLSSNFDDNPV